MDNYRVLESKDIEELERLFGEAKGIFNHLDELTFKEKIIKNLGIQTSLERIFNERENTVNYIARKVTQVDPQKLQSLKQKLNGTTSRMHRAKSQDVMAKQITKRDYEEFSKKLDTYY